MTAQMAAPAAEASSAAVRPGPSDDPAIAVNAGGGASAAFQPIFGPGAKVWDRLASWAREMAHAAARRRMRTLLDAAGVDDGFELEPIVDRLDADFLFRFGYALAACEEELAGVERLRASR
jgi:hypothetical protein